MYEVLKISHLIIVQNRYTARERQRIGLMPNRITIRRCRNNDNLELCQHYIFLAIYKLNII